MSMHNGAAPYLEAEMAYRRERMIQDWTAEPWWARIRTHLHPEESSRRGGNRSTSHVA